jgi:hypothetical protein
LTVHGRVAHAVYRTLRLMYADRTMRSIDALLDSTVAGHALREMQR